MCGEGGSTPDTSLSPRLAGWPGHRAGGWVTRLGLGTSVGVWRVLERRQERGLTKDTSYTSSYGHLEVGCQIAVTTVLPGDNSGQFCSVLLMVRITPLLLG